MIISGSRDYRIKIWNSNSGRVIKTLAGHSGYVYSIIISKNDEFVISASYDIVIKIWDSKNGKEIRS